MSKWQRRTVAVLVGAIIAMLGGAALSAVVKDGDTRGVMVIAAVFAGVAWVIKHWSVPREAQTVPLKPTETHGDTGSRNL